MKKKKIIGIVLIVVFTAAAIVSGVMFARQYSDAKASVDTFDDLAGLVVDIETTLPETPDETDEPAELTEEELRAQQAALAHEKYGALFEQNQDFIGWISVDGTSINYPVMQTPTNPDYYLKHAFDKSWSDYQEAPLRLFFFCARRGDVESRALLW